jgi:hypothetical protein
MKNQLSVQISFVQTPETTIRGELIKSRNKSVVTERESHQRLDCYAACPIIDSLGN